MPEYYLRDPFRHKRALVFGAVLPQEIASGHTAAGSAVHDAHLESVAVEAEVLLDALDQAFNRGVSADRTAAASLTSRP